MRRFIAGAVCPKCRVMDRLLVEILDGARRRRCVDCGYTDTEKENVLKEPSTRLDTRGRPDTPTSAVRIVTPGIFAPGVAPPGDASGSPERGPQGAKR